MVCLLFGCLKQAAYHLAAAVAGPHLPASRLAVGGNETVRNSNDFVTAAVVCGQRVLNRAELLDEAAHVRRFGTCELVDRLIIICETLTVRACAKRARTMANCAAFVSWNASMRRCG
jgi:hypothetical protein